jgi:hypothetical protein
LTTETLDTPLRAALDGSFTPKFLATLDADGEPNCVPVISIHPYNDGTLVFGEFLMQKSRANLGTCDKVGVAVFDEAFSGWSIKGRFRGFETSGERLDFVNNLPLLRYNAYTGVRAAGTIEVIEVSPAVSTSKYGVLGEYLRVRAVAGLSSRRSNGLCMPAQVSEKFRRIGAVRAAAYRDTDGFPRAFPLMACVPAGSDRLALRDRFAEAYLKNVEPGTRLAVAVITREPIAYQVKGAYAGTRAGAALIDLDACYSASPPLLGERLDKPAAV